MEGIELKGLAWDHQRGVGVLRDTSSLYTASRGNVTITWSARTLHQFGTQPLEEFAGLYDLLIIDHPFVGRAAASGILLPLQHLVPDETLTDLATNSVGKSFDSYWWDEQLWALPVDAAAQVAVSRPDLVEVPPKTWTAVLDLARSLSGGPKQVGIPFGPIDALMSFFSVCANLGEKPFNDVENVVSDETATQALTLLTELLAFAHAKSRHWGAINMLDCMSSTDEVAFCPLIFGYANYSRVGFAEHPLAFSDVPTSGLGPVGSVLGGTGLAVSASCQEPEVAADYAAWLLSAEVQAGPYLGRGGQPGHRAAWLSARNNELTNDFFSATLLTLDNSYLRPRFDGFTDFQDLAGSVVQEGCLQRRPADEILTDLRAIYRTVFSQ